MAKKNSKETVKENSDIGNVKPTTWLPPHPSIRENLLDEDGADPDGDRLSAFRDYLNKENPEWFKSHSFSCNTVIDYFMARHYPGQRLTKPEHLDFLQAMSEFDSNFK